MFILTWLCFPQSQTVTRIYFVREHSLHGIITGVEGIQVMASIEDKLDRLLVSFKDAKVASVLESSRMSLFCC